MGPVGHTQEGHPGLTTLFEEEAVCCLSRWCTSLLYLGQGPYAEERITHRAAHRALCSRAFFHLQIAMGGDGLLYGQNGRMESRRALSMIV